ncbi:hypothetical protein RUND412_002838 [Rhizina undulata]
MTSTEPRISGESPGRASVDVAALPVRNGDARGSSEERRSIDGKSASNSQTNAFQAAVGAWRQIDLTNLQKSLDATANEIVNSQRDNLVERKELAQKTKEFRKLDEEAKKEEWKGLLKSYQLFIDHLTTSKKATETSFLSLYSTLSEAPDPYPLLEATIDSLLSMSDMQKLSKENSSLNSTVSRLSSQISNLEASLHAKNKEIEKKEREKEEESKRVEEVWSGLLDEKTRNWEGKEKAFTEKLEHQESVLKEIKASYEVSQRMGGPKSGGEDDIMVKERMAELEIMTRDLERTTLRLAEAEARNEQLRLELANASSSEHSASKAEDKRDEEDPVLIRLQGENASLLKKVDSVKGDTEEKKREWERKVRGLERTLDGLKKDKDMLKEKISKWGDYEEIRRELEILKSIEFSTGDDDDDEMDFSKTGTVDGDEGGLKSPGLKGDKKETLEQLLLARNKKLGNELTVLRVSHQDLTTRLQTLQRTLDSTTSDLTSARVLNQKLEDDLLRFQYPPPPSMAHGSVSPTSSIISGYIPHSSSQTTLESLRAGENAGGSGILPMVTAQRDRFKQKNQQLEDELQRAHNTVSNLRQEVASLQKDNLQLYEKTRYISTYARSPITAGSSSGLGVNTNPAAHVHASNVSSNSSGSIDRYRQAYEANISPFEAFRGRESARAYHRMGFAERFVYSLTRVVLANRMSRNLFVGYCVFLHVLVFSVLYWAGTRGAEKQLVELASEKVAAAAVAAAGDSWRQGVMEGR